jgi:hypothetical protein
MDLVVMVKVVIVVEVIAVFKVKGDDRLGQCQ